MQFDICLTEKRHDGQMLGAAKLIVYLMFPNISTHYNSLNSLTTWRTMENHLPGIQPGSAHSWEAACDSPESKSHDHLRGKVFESTWVEPVNGDPMVTSLRLGEKWCHINIMFNEAQSNSMYVRFILFWSDQFSC